MWDLHPDKKNEKYTCAKCHTPTDLELLKKLEENEKAMPEKMIFKHKKLYLVHIATVSKILNLMQNQIITFLLQKKKFSILQMRKIKTKTIKSSKNEISLFGMMKEKSRFPFIKLIILMIISIQEAFVWDVILMPKMKMALTYVE